MSLFRLSRVFLFIGFIFFTLIQGMSEDLSRPKFKAIADWIKKEALNVQVLGTGGHKGECISMLMENPMPDTAFILIEPGRLLSSLDTNVQDILITREEMIALAPGEQRRIDVYGFCGQASCASPDSAEMFRVGEMADSSIISLAEFLNDRNNDFPEGAIQKAVWCLTDGYCISDIYSEDLASVADLKEMVASIMGVDAMWLDIDDIPYEDQSAPHHIKTVTGEIELYIPNNSVVDIFVIDEIGTTWDEFENQVHYKAGAYRYSFQLVTTHWPAGKYFICVLADGELIYKHEFEL